MIIIGLRNIKANLILTKIKEKKICRKESDCRISKNLYIIKEVSFIHIIFYFTINT